MPNLMTIAREAFRGVTTSQLTLKSGTRQFGPSSGYMHPHMLSCSGVQAVSLTSASMTCAISSGDTAIEASDNLYIETGDGLLALPGPLCESPADPGMSAACERSNRITCRRHLILPFPYWGVWSNVIRG